MSIKRGDVVSHSEANAWGIGKVVEVTPLKATVHFNDGMIRKIVNSHWECLLPALSSLYLPDSGAGQEVAAKTPIKVKKVKKEKK
ncbi:hypothetical protein GMST_28310 [Geomonas silvestris]|uniref:DUF3553 domain-containing protein n=1 Tax=Geomonas silvestris TaxID=2740184 RepID=A0A6V8MKK4_9BACT|nr:DUF3553 domain-containing protein [Geomonas silvestris]GFO60506.1 hypothetical protein GMST_28310 [Geomonas silvestris]